MFITKKRQGVCTSRIWKNVFCWGRVSSLTIRQTCAPEFRDPKCFDRSVERGSWTSSLLCLVTGLGPCFLECRM